MNTFWTMPQANSLGAQVELRYIRKEMKDAEKELE